MNNEEKPVALALAGDRLAGKVSAPVCGNIRAMATLTEGNTEVGKAQYNLTSR